MFVGLLNETKRGMRNDGGPRHIAIQSALAADSPALCSASYLQRHGWSPWIPSEQTAVVPMVHASNSLCLP